MQTVAAVAGGHAAAATAAAARVAALAAVSAAIFDAAAIAVCWESAQDLKCGLMKCLYTQREAANPKR